MCLLTGVAWGSDGGAWRGVRSVDAKAEQDAAGLVVAVEEDVAGLRLAPHLHRLLVGDAREASKHDRLQVVLLVAVGEVVGGKAAAREDLHLSQQTLVRVTLPTHTLAIDRPITQVIKRFTVYRRKLETLHVQRKYFVFSVFISTD